MTLAACSPSPEDALANFCDAQDDLLTSIGAISDLSLGSPADDVVAVRDDISGAWNDYVSAADELAEVQIAGVQSAYQGFLDAVDAIPDGASIGEAIQLSIEAADVFLAQVREVRSSVSCG